MRPKIKDHAYFCTDAKICRQNKRRIYTSRCSQITPLHILSFTRTMNDDDMCMYTHVFPYTGHTSPVDHRGTRNKKYFFFLVIYAKIFKDFSYICFYVEISKTKLISKNDQIHEVVGATSH